MTYYNDAQGSTFTFYKEGFVERELPLKDDGTVLPNHKNLHLLVGEGKYYKTTPDVNGKYQPDTVKNNADAQAQTDAQAKIDRKQAMLTGMDYNGTMVSLTKDDGNGVQQIKTAFELGMPTVTLHCENGNKVPFASQAEFMAFLSWFAVERGKFYV